MKQQNALLVALNALQAIDDTHPYPIAKHAIVQISKALAQSEPQVCCGDYEKCMNACTPRGRWLAEKELAKPAQEPVAWMEDSIEFYAKDHPTNSCTIPLYTAPPSKQEQEQESEAFGYAKRLAEFIWKKHYKEESPDWKPLGNILGVLTQIDNMTCGLEKAKPEQGCAECRVKASDGYALYCVKCTELFTQPEQEPVMEVQYFWDSPVYILLQPISDGAKLYTAPPRKQWIGLTDEEIFFTYEKCTWASGYISWNEFARAIEAALRSKHD